MIDYGDIKISYSIGKKIKNLQSLTQECFSIKNIGKYSANKYTGGCGTAALSMLTGEPPSKVDKHLPNHLRKGEYWTDKAITEYLKKRKFGVYALDIKSIIGSKGFITNPIKHDHVLLIGQWVYEEEGTWCIVNNGARYHNFKMEPLTLLEFINNPIDSVYIITHKNWE